MGFHEFEKLKCKNCGKKENLYTTFIDSTGI